MPSPKAPDMPGQGHAGLTGVRRQDMRLPPSRRIVDSSVFRLVFDLGRKYPGAFMVLWLGGGQGPATRVGVVASKRAFARAVDRNRARRLLREAFRKNHFRLRRGVDVILLARTRILDVGGREVEAEFMKLAARAHLLQDAAAKRESE